MSDSQNEPAPFFTRSGVSNIFGKNTEEVKARLPFEIKQGFIRIAHEHNMTESELLRELIMIRVVGFDMYKKIQEDRLTSVAGIGNEE
ncbi:MAG: hypothetical protein WC696_12295 [Candidatus Methylopumilus sp.]|jgi:hypothetical protein